MIKTVQQCKDELASKRGYKDWDDLVFQSSISEYAKCRRMINEMFLDQKDQQEEKKSFMAYAVYALVVAFQYILAVVVCVVMRVLLNTFMSPFADFDMAIGWAGGTAFVLMIEFYSAKWTNWICKFLMIK